MIHALLCVTLALHPPDGRPVRVWLSPGPGPVQGDRVHVYVQTSTDANLVVLHARPDGRVEVLFPGDPEDDPFVRAGTYEIEGPTGAAAFVAEAPRGIGTVLAAISSDRLWLDEFVRDAVWDIADRVGFDAEGTLSDVVQRMLGDGTFNYDVATYSVTPAPELASVAPPPAPMPSAAAPASEPAPPTVSPCATCDVAQVNIIVGDLPVALRRHHRRLRVPPAAPPVPTSAIAVYTGHQPVPLVHASRPSPEVQPRRRDPDPAAPRPVPLVARRRPDEARPTALARSLALVRPARAGRRSAAEPVAVAQPSAASPTSIPAGATIAAAPVRPPAGTLTLIPRAAPAAQRVTPVEAQPKTFALPHPPGLPLYRARGK